MVLVLIYVYQVRSAELDPRLSLLWQVGKEVFRPCKSSGDAGCPYRDLTYPGLTVSHTTSLWSE